MTLQILLILILLFLSIIFLIISKVNKNKAKKMKIRYNIIQGKITYTDLNKPADALFSKKYRLSGKPDYIIENKNFLIPVEVKSARYKEPQKNHIFQLAGYCHLLEENYGCFVPYGILVYNNSEQFKIPFNPKIRYELETTIYKMKDSLKTGRVERNHTELSKCKNCSLKTYCNFKII